MEINLLPAKPKTKQFKWPLTLLAFSIIIPFSALIGLQFNELLQKVSERKAVLASMEMQQASLITEEGQLSPYAGQIAGFLLEAEALEKSRIPWVAMMDKLSGYLPQTGYLVSVVSDGNDIIEISGQMTTMNDIAGFMQSLQNDASIIASNLIEITSQAEGKSGYQFSMRVQYDPLATKKIVE